MTPKPPNSPTPNTTRAFLGLAIAMALAGCPGTHGGDPDGGTNGDGGTGAPIELDFHVEGGGGTGDWHLEGVSARIDVLDVHSDLGPVGDPHLVALGTVSLLPESEIITSIAPPGTYSQISLVLAASGAEASWTLALARSSGQTITVRSSLELPLEARCGTPASIESDDALGLTISLDGDALVAAVDAASIPVMAGASTLDETNAPALVDALEDVLVASIALACD